VRFRALAAVSMRAFVISAAAFLSRLSVPHFVLFLFCFAIVSKAH
jgi:hypothetical protein